MATQHKWRGHWFGAGHHAISLKSWPSILSSISGTSMIIKCKVVLYVQDMVGVDLLSAASPSFDVQVGCLVHTMTYHTHIVTYHTHTVTYHAEVLCSVPCAFHSPRTFTRPTQAEMNLSLLSTTCSSRPVLLKHYNTTILAGCELTQTVQYLI